MQKINRLRIGRVFDTIIDCIIDRWSLSFLVNILRVIPKHDSRVARVFFSRQVNQVHEQHPSANFYAGDNLSRFLEDRKGKLKAVNIDLYNDTLKVDMAHYLYNTTYDAEKTDLSSKYVTGFLKSDPACEAIEAARKRLKFKVMEYEERTRSSEVSSYNGSVFRAIRNVLPLLKEQNIRGFKCLYL